MKRNKIIHLIDIVLYKIRSTYRRLFIVIDIKEAKERNLSFVGNVWGDEINKLNCRSIWYDDKKRRWRVKQLG